mmetsp:Transcript_15558/g.26371  ORF Transcript_15558/g.26371 Transcript_15558/m.26371 type:complete len:94 (+) Transcript_15558:206-487(+)
MALFVREGSFIHAESSAAGAFAALRFGKSVLVFQMRVPLMALFHEVKNQFMFVSHLKSHMLVYRGSCSSSADGNEIEALFVVEVSKYSNSETD